VRFQRYLATRVTSRDLHIDTLHIDTLHIDTLHIDTLHIDKSNTAAAPRDLVANVASLCHTCAMARSRVSTTVDQGLLSEARTANPQHNDAALFDAALAALLSRSRAAVIDDSYRVYDEHPLDEPDEWGDLKSFRSAASAT
jgi:hypothetical protein